MDKSEQDIRDEAWQDGYTFGRAIGRAAEQYRAGRIRGGALILGFICGGFFAIAVALMARLWGAK